MSQPFEIDTDALARAEAPFRELAQRLVALSQQVQADVRGLGPVWGDDKSGQEFAAKYGPTRDDLLEALRSTGDVVSSTADGVHTMAQGFHRTEESNRDAASELLRRTRTEVDATTGAADVGMVAGSRREAIAALPVTHARTHTVSAVRQREVSPTHLAVADTAQVDVVAAQPLRPTDMVVAAQPVQSRRHGLLPASPVEPARPALPSEPVVPALPMLPTESLQPTRAAERSLPAQPAVAAERSVAQPAEPTEPAQLALAAERDVATEPVQPRQHEALAAERTPMVRADAVEPLRPTTLREVDAPAAASIARTATVSRSEPDTTTGA
jgi:hypothetical protein